MSEVYIKEPNTKGKVVLQTTHGDLEIELWATEAPKACRNFCTLILEGYYNDTIFHRVIKDFLIQGGDSTGTGTGCESIYGKPYEDEIHPRLKFRYRGMMGIANGGKGTNSNGSQFFIVLNRSPTLDMKHTLFAKVVGQTIYNLVRLCEVEVDKNDRPVEPPRVLRAELIWDPFDDLEPRYKPAPLSIRAPGQPQKREAVHKKSRLSFDDSDGDDSEDDKVKAGKAKAGSAHDALNDPTLSKEARGRRAAEEEAGRRRRVPEDADDAGAAGKRARAEPEASRRGKTEAPPASDGSGADFSGSDSEDSDGGPKNAFAAAKRQEEILKLKRDIAGISAGGSDDAGRKKGSAGSALEERRAGFKTREKHVKAVGKDGKRRAAADIADTLKSFASKLKEAAVDKDQEDQDAKDARKRKEAGTFSSVWEEGEEEGDSDWLTGGGLKFHTSGDKAFKLAMYKKGREQLEIFDPLAAKGNDEILAAQRKIRSDRLKAVPSMKRAEPISHW